VISIFKDIGNQLKFYFKKYGFFKTILKSCIVLFWSIFIPSGKERYNYKNWIKYNEPDLKELEEQQKTKFNLEPKISLIVPMYNTPVDFFSELVNCLINQTYSNWELCLADGSENKNDEIENICKKDNRIKYKFLNENKGISGNSNETLKLATGDYIGLLDHDDMIPVFALYEIVKTINENPNVEFIYTDEDKIEGNAKNRFDPHFKPDFAIDTLRTNNYITHFSVFKKELMDKLQGFRSKYDGAQDYDIILRMSEETKNIIHIPKVLYHWRVHKTSTAKISDAKPYAYEAGLEAIKDHLERMGLKAKVEHSGDIWGVYKIEYEVKGNPKVSIVIPNKDAVNILKKCIESILNLTTYSNYEIVIVENNSEKEETFTYYKELEKNEKIKVVYYPEKGFNYSKLINFGVRNSDANSEYVLQLNNDTELITKNWLEQFIGYCQRGDMGALGAKLYYEDKTTQHTGIIVGIGGLAANVLQNVPYKSHGYFGRENLPQNLSAVTGACLFAKRKLYEEVGYMDERLAVAFNDVDFCLKIIQKGYKIVYNPYIELMHYESKTRGYEDNMEKKKRYNEESNLFKEKWKSFIEKGDPYYNINFRNDSDQYKVYSRDVKNKLEGKK